MDRALNIIEDILSIFKRMVMLFMSMIILIK